MDSNQLMLSMSDRIINLMGDVDECTVKDVIEKIVNLNCKDCEYIDNVQRAIGMMGFGVSADNIQVPPIIINLSTYGGDVYSGFALCDSIRTSDTPIKIICYGKIMSMGIPILLSAKNKGAHRNTTFMIHGISSINFGKAQQMRENMEENNRLENMLVDYILKNSKFPKKKLTDIIEKKQDYFFSAEEALKYKIIDEIID